MICRTFFFFLIAQLNCILVCTTSRGEQIHTGNKPVYQNASVILGLDLLSANKSDKCEWIRFGTWIEKDILNYKTDVNTNVANVSNAAHIILDIILLLLNAFS